MKLGLIGHPVGHSMSPWIHGKLFEQQGLNGTYQLYDVKPEEFEAFIPKLKEEGLDGFNLTVPHKERILPFLDGLDESAEALGAVNTVKRTDKGWIGYNTDGTGFVHSMKNRYPKKINTATRVLLLGAGGAARGIFHAFLTEGVATIDVSNRTVSRAQAIVETGNPKVQSKALSLDDVQSSLGEYDVIVQTTTVGMSPEDEEVIIPLENLTKDTIVSDIVYRPMETLFLKKAKRQGANVHYGHEMLLQQAVYAFQIWTGTNPSALEILDEFEAKLKGV
ncbi:shikimate dehydrogenase [Halobacillus fulvus]|nr:shikimate dehydrogenase [Halobacillus fulvus]